VQAIASAAGFTLAIGIDPPEGTDHANAYHQQVVDMANEAVAAGEDQWGFAVYPSVQVRPSAAPDVIFIAALTDTPSGWLAGACRAGDVGA
jgi:hypothetical protein